MARKKVSNYLKVVPLAEYWHEPLPPEWQQTAATIQQTLRRLRDLTARMHGVAEAMRGGDDPVMVRHTAAIIDGASATIGRLADELIVAVESLVRLVLPPRPHGA